MAPFERNIVTRIALIGVFISIFMTDSTIACNNDFTTCRYNCPAEVVQKHCTSENEVHWAVDGKCCPGYFRTKNSCQVCPDVQFMPDVNNCCECLPCAECDDIKNNTEVVPCDFTRNTVCKIQDDPTPRGTYDCPWVESTSTPTSQVPTTQVPTTDTEESTVDTPRDPHKSTFEEPYKDRYYAFMVSFIFSLVLNVLLCYCIYKKGQPANQPGGQPGGQPANQPGGQPANQPAIQPVNQPGGQPAIQPGGQPANQPGGQPANQLVNQPGGQPGGQPANQPVNQPGGQPTNQPANQAGGGGQIRGQVEEDHSDKSGDDEPDVQVPLLPRGDVPQEEENQRDQTTSV